jgi:hypothetical protein
VFSVVFEPRINTNRHEYFLTQIYADLHRFFYHEVHEDHEGAGTVWEIAASFARFQVKFGWSCSELRSCADQPNFALLTSSGDFLAGLHQATSSVRASVLLEGSDRSAAPNRFRQGV